MGPRKKRGAGGIQVPEPQFICRKRGGKKGVNRELVAAHLSSRSEAFLAAAKCRASLPLFGVVRLGDREGALLHHIEIVGLPSGRAETRAVSLGL